MRKEGFGAVLVLLLLAMAVVVYAIFIGTVEGYVTYMNGSLITGASVSVTVASCSESCTGTATTDSGGYYVIANLNLPASGSISGTATKGGDDGSASATADAFQAAFMNITVCIPPSNPVLVDEGNTHDLSAVLEWTSGVDPLSLSTTDIYTYEGSDTNVSSSGSNSYNQTSIDASSNTTRTWSVKTCNGLCCSNTSSDTFVAVNDAPPAPTLTAVPDTHDQNATFIWVSYADPDGDPVYDQYKIDSGSYSGQQTSPKNASGLSFASHTWYVRTCDDRSACTESSDTFTVGNTAPGTPNLTLEDNTEALDQTFEWVQGVDPEGDGVRNEIQVSNDSSYSNILSSSTNQSSPALVSGLSAFQVIYWRVRTCDYLGECSSYATDSFITYDCPDSGGGSGGGGGGGGGSCPCQNECEGGLSYCSGNDRIVCGSFDSDSCTDLATIPCSIGERCVEGQCLPACTPNWLCTEWTECRSGDDDDWSEGGRVTVCHNSQSITVDESALDAHLNHGDHVGPCNTGGQTRVCSDLNRCGILTDKPEESKQCDLPEAEAPFELLGIEVPSVIKVSIRTAILPYALPLVSLIALGLVGFGLAGLFFKEELAHARLRWKLFRVNRLVKRRKYGKAYGKMMSGVEPLWKSVRPRLKSSLDYHRGTMHLYNKSKAALNKALADTAREQGEHSLSAAHSRRAKEFAERAKKYLRKK